MFWLYRYKGFSRTAARTVHTAVVLAGQQTAGRGRMGRSFQSPAGLGLYGSVLLLSLIHL